MQRVLLCVIFVGGMAVVSYGQDATWTGGAGDGDWSKDDNWDNGTPENGDIVLFDGDKATFPVTLNNIDSAPAKIELTNEADVIFGDIGDFTGGSGDILYINGGILEINEKSSLDLNSKNLHLINSDFLVSNGDFIPNGGKVLINVPGGENKTMSVDDDISFYNIQLDIEDDIFDGAGELNIESSNGNVLMNVFGLLEFSGEANVNFSDIEVNYDGEGSLKYSGHRTIGNEWTESSELRNLTINSPNIFQLNDDAGRSLSGTLEFKTNSELNLGTNTLEVKGSVVNSSVEGSGTIDDETTLRLGNQDGDNETQQVQDGTIELNKLTVDKSAGNSDTVFVKNGAGFDFTSDGTLTIENGVLDLESEDVALLNRGNADLIINDGAELRTGGQDIDGFNSYSVSSGKIVFSGGSSQNIPDGISDLGTLVIDNSGSDVSVSDTKTHIINKELDLISGNINGGGQQDSTIRLSENATVSGGSDDSYVDGFIEAEFSEEGTATFPVGDEDGYRPAVFEYESFDGSETSIISIRYVEGDFSTGNNPSGITEISNDGRYELYEAGETPGNFTYSFTGRYDDIELSPAENIRILIQESDDDYTFEPAQTVDEGENTVTVSGLNELPYEGEPRIVFGLEGDIVLFVGDGDGTDWYDTENWSTGSLPGSAEEVEIEDETVEIGSGEYIEIESLTLAGSSTLTITSENSNDPAIEVGADEGDDIVLSIAENSKFNIEGGSGRVIQLSNSSDEKVEVKGTLNLAAADGLGSGSSRLPGDRQIFGEESTFIVDISLDDILPADDYGNLEIDGGGSLEIGKDLTIHGELALNDGEIDFIHEEGIDNKTFEVKDDMTVGGTFNAGSGGGVDNKLVTRGELIDDGGSFLNMEILNFELGNTSNIPEAITQVAEFTLTEETVTSLSGDLTVTDTLRFSNGYIETGDNTLTVGTDTNPGEIIEGEGFVIGTLRRYLEDTRENEEIVFPVGNEEDEDEYIYRPAQIEFTDLNESGHVRAEFIEGDPGQLDENLIDNEGEEDEYVVENVGVNGYWRIEDENIGETFEYDIELNATQFVGVNNPEDLRILRRDDSEADWELTGDHLAGEEEEEDVYVIRRSSINTFSEFAIGGDEEDPLPVELVNFEITTNGSSYPELIWETETEKENEGFRVERRMQEGEEDWDKIAFVEGNGTTTENQEYKLVDEELDKATVYEYRLIQEDYDGTSETYGPEMFTFEEPRRVELDQNYPNPFNPETTIPYQVPEESDVTIEVYNTLGQKVQTLVDDQMSPGTYTAEFDGSNLSSGTYIVRLSSGGKTESMQIQLVK